MCHLACVMCDMSHVICHLSHITNANTMATDPNAANSPTIYSRVVRKDQLPSPPKKLFYLANMLFEQKY